MNAPGTLEVLRPALGPSSSHTFGPLRAAQNFAELVRKQLSLGATVRVTLYGSLARTGRGHLTDAAIAAGLAGYGLERLRSRPLRELFADLVQAAPIAVGRARFHPIRDVVFETEVAPVHPNSMRFELRDRSNRVLLSTLYLSVGGGTVVGGTVAPPPAANQSGDPFSMSQVVEQCEARGESLAEFALRRETAEFGHSPDTVRAHMFEVWNVMRSCMAAGLGHEGLLPGTLGTRRRAPALLRQYQARFEAGGLLFADTTRTSIYAIAVAEENADGAIVVAAPTCGSSGVLPACMRAIQESRGIRSEQVVDALLVAGIIGVAAVARASIAGAVVGCQGEIGVASAMAAGAVCHLSGGTVRDQVDRAAETALEHFLGLACDPVGGLVQIPCIERNAAGAVSALNAAELALLSGGRDRVSFDATLDAMREIGHDMSDKYRETGLGGLAVAGRCDGAGYDADRQGKSIRTGELR